ncbi:hypothetical protein ACFQ1S_02165, partial [Kibdelosporangium lantanae]
SAAVALLLAHEALAYAHLNDPRQAMTALRRAEDEYAHATDDDWPEFLQFFDRGALDTSAARVHSKLGLTEPHHRTEAITRLHNAIDNGPTDRVRQRAFNLIWLAACTLADGDLTTGAHIGNQALTSVASLNSPRLIKHLEPLNTQLQRHPNHADLRHLTHELRQLSTPA